MFTSRFYNAVLVIIFFMMSITLFADDDFTKWKSQQDQSFRTYKDAQDKAFVEFLEKNWEAFELFKAESFDETPKPEEMPVAEESDLPELPETQVVKEVELPKVELQQEEIEEKHFISFVDKEKDADFTITYWGQPLKFKYNQKFDLKLTQPIDHKQIANFWYVASNSEHDTFLNQLSDYRERLKLNDWGLCLLLNDIGKVVTGDSENLTKLFVWYFLTKSGFDTKVGYSTDNIYLMIASDNTIFGVPYLKFGDKRFFVVSLDKKEKLSGAIYSYDGNYPDADNNLSLKIDATPLLRKVMVERELQFKYLNKIYLLRIKYDESTAKYLANYPQTNLDVYFGAPLSPEAYYSLASQMKPIIEGKSQAEAVNILLRFVQSAFDYKTDGEQFGYEKSFFSDETLYYPYSDCEDRSILFSFLVRNLLGMEVIGLDYPGHIATGVKFDRYIKGDAVKYKGDRYLICDPTYINANIGMAMPEVKKEIPKLIRI